MGEGNYTAVNLACGERFITSPQWTNLDFYSASPHVLACNFLSGIPIEDSTVDFVYSSHALEHFDRIQAAELLTETLRILKPGGSIRIVVPDLEDSARNYLEALAERRSGGRREKHEWAVIELIDQMVRRKAEGEMGRVFREIRESGDEELRQLVMKRTGFDVNEHVVSHQDSVLQKLKRVSPSLISLKLKQWYIAMIRRLLPRSLRNMIVDETPAGEKHKWMYDRESLNDLLSATGFGQVRFHTASTSGSSLFLQDNLDLHENGKPYKQASLYAEAVKPL